MFNLSSAMGAKFVEYAVDMTERIRKLGPSPLRRSSIAGAEDTEKIVWNRECGIWKR